MTVDGRLPKTFGVTRGQVSAAAAHFASRSASRIDTPFREVTVILQNDDESAAVHLAINGAEGPTDVITQRYDPMPGEADGVYGELYVNADRALAVASRARGWSPLKELLLYIAHGMDHLSGADDLEEADFRRMRRRELDWLKTWVEKLLRGGIAS